MDSSVPSIEAILARAVDIADESERRAYVAAACGADAALRDRVERLVANHFRAGDFLERPAAVLPPPAGPTADPLVGTRVGPYKLLERIGEGGMGVVYVAEQKAPVRREVALKLVKPGMDSKQVVARFEAERQALALMGHPNVAKVLDAGAVPDGPLAGRPYFVMELIRGLPVTEYCDRARLTIRQRLGVFLDVCRAVQHAHTKGVIHRDLKPGNVLVTSHDGVPVPMVIDFGVAKALGGALTEHTVHTGFAQMVGTPMYMSPEQAEFNQLGADTRSDIYSLGVLLYELLTGTTPFDGERLKTAGFDELRRILRDEDPPHPSARLSTLGNVLPTATERRATDARQLAQALRGELDWIVLKALEKDRSRRYETASELGADVQRYLNDEAVLAGPPSPGYRLRKFARRHRRALATAGVVLVSLAAAAGVSIWEAARARAAERKARAAEARAETAAATARAVDAFLQQDLLGRVDADPRAADGSGGPGDLTVREALDRAAAKIGTRFHDRPLVEAGVRLAIGRAYRSLTLNQQGIPHLERALALRRAHLEPGDPDLLDSIDALALAYSWATRHDEAIALRQESLEDSTARFGPDDPRTISRRSLLANAYQMASRLDQCIPLLEDLLRQKRELLGATDPGTLNTMHNLAMCYVHANRLADSISLHEECMAALQAKYGPDHEATIWPRMTFAQACYLAGDLDRAERLLREALAAIEHQEPSRRFRGAHARALGWLARLQWARKNYAEAERLVRETLAALKREPTDDPGRHYWSGLLGVILLGQERYAEAGPLILKSYEALKEGETTHHIERRNVAEAADWVVRYYEATNQPEKARAFRQTLTPR